MNETEMKGIEYILQDMFKGKIGVISDSAAIVQHCEKKGIACVSVDDILRKIKGVQLEKCANCEEMHEQSIEPLKFGGIEMKVCPNIPPGYRLPILKEGK